MPTLVEPGMITFCFCTLAVASLFLPTCVRADSVLQCLDQVLARESRLRAAGCCPRKKLGTQTSFVPLIQSARYSAQHQTKKRGKMGGGGEEGH